MMPKDILTATAARERMELYCLAKPRSPSAIRRPQLSIRSGVWVALLGESIREGIVGLGATVEAALAAFDEQYLKVIRVPKRKAVARTILRRVSRKSLGNRRQNLVFRK